eukprot:357381-Chlamydomonas_euryale.AAC.21
MLGCLCVEVQSVLHLEHGQVLHLKCRHMRALACARGSMREGLHASMHADCRRPCRFLLKKARARGATRGKEKFVCPKSDCTIPLLPSFHGLMPSFHVLMPASARYVGTHA